MELRIWKQFLDPRGSDWVTKDPFESAILKSFFNFPDDSVSRFSRSSSFWSQSMTRRKSTFLMNGIGWNASWAKMLSIFFWGQLFWELNVLNGKARVSSQSDEARVKLSCCIQLRPMKPTLLLQFHVFVEILSSHFYLLLQNTVQINFAQGCVIWSHVCR